MLPPSDPPKHVPARDDGLETKGDHARSAVGAARALSRPSTPLRETVAPPPSDGRLPADHACGAALRGRGAASEARKAEGTERRGFGAGDECTLCGAPADQAAADHPTAADAPSTGVVTGTGAAGFGVRRGVGRA